MVRRVVNKLRRMKAEVRWRAEPHVAQALIAWRWRFRRRWKPHGLGAPLIISVTSYRPRFASLALTLRCLLSQTVKADHTILWISHEDMPHLPHDVTALQKYGLEIIATEDLKSYKKIIPTLKRFPGAFICTADDDVYYWPGWLQELIDGMDPTGKIVACHRAHEITLNADGSFRPYQEWVLDTRQRHILPSLFATGIGGVLYPPGIFAPEVLEESTFMELCPHGDDIWLYWMARRNGARYRTVGPHRGIITWKGSQESALWHVNMSAGRNDAQIRAIAARFGYSKIDD